MNIHTILFSLTCAENIEDAELFDLLKTKSNTYASDENLSLTLTSYYTTVFPCCCESESEAAYPEECPLWLQLGDNASYSTHAKNCLKCIQKQETAVNCVVERLQNIANSLPKLGAYVNVIWVESGAWPDFESNLGVYGVLKCLLEWYHAELDFVHVDDYSEESWISWCDALPSETWKLRDQPKKDRHLKNVLWKGGVKISTTKNQLTLPGLSFHPYSPSKAVGVSIKYDDKRRDPEAAPEPRLLAPHLELLAALDLDQIPTFYISSDALQVCIASSPHPTYIKTRQFMDLLTENCKLCYLVRLAYGTSWSDCVTSGFKFPQPTFVDAVLDNINNIYEPPFKAELTGDTGMQQYLLCLGPDGIFLAYPVHRLEDIMAKPFHDMFVREMQGCYNKTPSAEHKSEVSALMADVPHFSAHTLLQLHEDIEVLQAEVLKQWIVEHEKSADEAEISPEELALLLTTTRNVYFDKMLGDPEFMEHCKRPNIEPQALRPFRPEFENNFDLLERLVLQVRHVTADKLARLKSKSSDSLGGLSPPVKAGGKTITLDANQFLKSFKANGSAKREGKNYLLPKKKPTLKYDNSEAMTAKWSDHKLPSDFHDIYYYRGDVSEKMEEKCERLKARVLGVETSSTCTVESAPPASLILSPIRPPPATATHTFSPAGPSKSTTRSNKQTPPKKEVPAEVSRRKPVGGVKRSRDPEESIAADAKRLYMAKKQKLEAAASSRPAPADMTVDKQAAAKSRSQRHKQKLLDVIKLTLAEEGIHKGNAIYKPCFNKLYTITFTFVKDLRNYTSLTAEMKKIAQSQVKSVVSFEQSQQKS